MSSVFDNEFEHLVDVYFSPGILFNCIPIRDEVFAAFGADPEWTELRAKYAVPLDIVAFMMSASDYSALK